MKTMVSLLTISIFLTVWVAPFVPALETPTTPSGIPVSELEQFVDEYAAGHMGVKTAGASVAIYKGFKDGETVRNKAYGYAIQDEVKAGTDSVFEWGSATKLLVWTSVMQLVEQGLIDLNSDIRNYLPPDFFKKLKYETPVTMYNLMHHNAGWEDSIVNLFYSSPKVVPSLERSLLYNEPAQIYKPGTVVAYSNYGTALAGYIVEFISGKPFYEYVWENIFEPLDMKDTALHPLQKDNPAVAEKRGQIKGHIPGKGKPVPSKGERIFIGLYPAGSVIGTAGDAIKFLAALLPAENETSLLFNDNNTLNEMLTVNYSLRENFPGIAHGFFEYFSSVKTLGHGGNTVAFSSLFTLSPEERFAVVIMTNQAQETAMCNGLTKALFGEYKPPETTEKFPDAGKFTGFYTMARRPASGFTKLIMSLMSTFPFKSVDENTLDLGGAKLIQISPYVFINTGGNDFLDIVNFLGFETADDPEQGSVVTRASIGYFDLLPVSLGEVVVLYGSLVLMVLCLLFVPAAIIITVVGAVKNRKKRIPFNLMKKLNIILFSSMAAAVINNVILAVRALSFSTYSSLMAHFIINVAYIVFAQVCIGFMATNWKKDESKGNRVFFVFSIVFTAVFAVLLTIWEFWR